jgi:hypothetical protein
MESRVQGGGGFARPQLQNFKSSVGLRAQTPNHKAAGLRHLSRYLPFHCLPDCVDFPRIPSVVGIVEATARKSKACNLLRQILLGIQAQELVGPQLGRVSGSNQDLAFQPRSRFLSPPLIENQNQK